MMPLLYGLNSTLISTGLRNAKVFHMDLKVRLTLSNGLPVSTHLMEPSSLFLIQELLSL
jgi:hypothetical protein